MQRSNWAQTFRSCHCRQLLRVLLSDHAQQLVGCSFLKLIAPEELNGFLLFTGETGDQDKVNIDGRYVDNVDASIRTAYVKLRHTSGNVIPAELFCLLPTLYQLHRRKATDYLGPSKYTSRPRYEHKSSTCAWKQQAHAQQ